MKVLFFSDLHHRLDSAQLLVQRFQTEQPDSIIACGDYTLYGSQGAAIAALFKPYSTIMAGVMGNNDSVWDKDLMPFTLNESFLMLKADDYTFYITHGHRTSMDFLPNNNINYDIFVQGHSHIAVIKLLPNGCVGLNPGSVALPRGTLPPSYAMYQHNTLTINLLRNGEAVETFPLKKEELNNKNNK